MNLRAFEHIPLYLLLKFLSRPATTPIEIFYEEVFHYFYTPSKINTYRTYRIGGRRRFNGRSELNEIDFDGDHWGMSPDMFSERQPFDYIIGDWEKSSGWLIDVAPSRKELVRNLIHESIQLKMGLLGEKRFPMNYFRRGINLES